jgi:hypothetical protein
MHFIPIDFSSESHPDGVDRPQATRKFLQSFERIRGRTFRTGQAAEQVRVVDDFFPLNDDRRPEGSE